jgi:hypothetical protein
MGAPRQSVFDPDGREVAFDAGSHLHLALGSRSRLLDHVETILGVIALPDHRSHDPRPGRERFYGQNPLEPERWLRVVVDFNDVPAWVVTAVIENGDPRWR